MRISLCLIVGNESAHIARCLAAFTPAVDEVSMVRAIGSQPPDDTHHLARAFCAERGIPFLFSEYTNAEHAREWDHVDDFAAARNQSFAQSTGDWLVWADADDVVDPASDIQELRALAERADVDVWHMQYNVPGTHKAPIRERMIRRSLYEAGRKWRYAVHENIAIRAGDRAQLSPHPIWLHAPSSQKKAGSKRNLQILDGALSEVPAQLFYVHQEHQCSGAYGKARHFGELALTFPSLDHSFRYEILLNLARGAKNRTHAAEFAARAFAVMPHCREALAALALLAFEAGDAPRALSLTSTMLALPEPAPELRPWTHEARWYGWAGHDLRARALRFAGRHQEAEAEQAAVHGGTGPIISLLHATRGRPQQAVECRDAWLGTASNPGAIEHLYAIDEDDRASLEMARQFAHVVASPAGSCVRAWNAAAAASKGKLLVQLSDDWLPSPGWDVALLQAIADAGKDIDRDELVIAVSDGTRTDGLLCMAICNRVRYEVYQKRDWDDSYKPYLFHPSYESVYSDNEFSHRAWRDGVVIDARASITFQHLHPAFGKATMDATYEATNSAERYARGKAIFERRNPDAITK